MTIGPDSVAGGLVATLARPEGNVTGLNTLTAELAAKRLELLRDMLPGIQRVAVLWNPAVPDRAVDLKNIQVAAQTLRVEIQSSEVRSSDELNDKFKAIVKGRAEALVILADPMTMTHNATIIEFATRKRLPTMFNQRPPVDAGGLVSYGTNYEDAFRHAARYVDKILRGAKPTDLPIQQPTTFELVTTSRPPRLSASRSRPRCSRGRIRSSNSGPPPLPADLADWGDRCAAGCRRAAGRQALSNRPARAESAGDSAAASAGFVDTLRARRYSEGREEQKQGGGRIRSDESRLDRRDIRRSRSRGQASDRNDPDRDCGGRQSRTTGAWSQALPARGGNVTGVSNMAIEWSAKPLQIIKDDLPERTRVAILWNPDNPASALTFRETDLSAAKAFGDVCVRRGGPKRRRSGARSEHGAA